MSKVSEMFHKNWIMSTFSFFSDRKPCLEGEEESHDCIMY